MPECRRDLCAEADRLFEYIQRVKYHRYRYAEEYKRDANAMIKLAMELWNYVPDHHYMPPPRSPEEVSKKLLLTVFIAEHILLRECRGLWRHLTFSIVGVGGSGKTTYAILSAYGALRLLGFSHDEAINIVSSLTFFTAKDFVEFMYSLAENRRWVPFVILDDAGAQLSKYWHWIGERELVFLFSTLDQMKDWIGTMILTARSFTSIAARLREITDIVIEAMTVSTGGGTVNRFRYYLTDDYTKRSRRRELCTYLDVMPINIKMPQELWEKMVETRRQTAVERLRVVKEFLEIEPMLFAQRVEKLKEKVMKRMEKDREVEEEEVSV